MSDTSKQAGASAPASAKVPAASIAPGAAADFASRDPGSAAFWDERFERGFVPWDLARVPDAFAAFAAARSPCPVLIPGCGSAHEALWLARAGWPVKAIDFSASAVATARRQLGEHAGLVEEADFFAYTPPFRPQWIYERAFLCALPPARWDDYAARMARCCPRAVCWPAASSSARRPRDRRSGSTAMRSMPCSARISRWRKRARSRIRCRCSKGASNG